MGLLREFAVQRVVDVRSIPHSAHNPQFDTHALRRSLPEAGINYVHMTGLGGFRRPDPASVNIGWRNESFRAFADYMQTEEFAAALDQLIVLARAESVAIMCAEAVPWRCHRSLIADALLVRGLEVVHIHGHGTAKPHRLTPFARVEGATITYPAPADGAGGEAEA